MQMTGASCGVFCSLCVVSCRLMQCSCISLGTKGEMCTSKKLSVSCMRAVTVSTRSLMQQYRIKEARWRSDKRLCRVGRRAIDAVRGGLCDGWYWMCVVRAREWMA